MEQQLFSSIIKGLQEGSVIPYLGAGALRDCTHADSGASIPASSDELILAINRGKPMSAKLMYEFPRAAMHIELKSGRSAVNKALSAIYDDEGWQATPLHQWLSGLDLPYIIDINRDTLLQRLYRERPHILIEGIARIAGTDYRYRIFQHEGTYREIPGGEIPAGMPLLFKPMGSPWPAQNYIASDADYVDYITELMGGFAVPSFVKALRKDKRYLFLGMRFNRDTERMVMSEITRDGSEPLGWALIPEPTAKEQRFCEKMGITIVEADIADLLSAAGVATAEATA